MILLLDQSEASFWFKTLAHVPRQSAVSFTATLTEKFHSLGNTFSLYLIDDQKILSLMSTG